MAPAQNGIQQYVKLEERLVLLAWLNNLFGYKSNRDLLADMKEADEGFDASGRSFVYHHLVARGDKVKIPPADLARYDDNIRAHLAGDERAPAGADHPALLPVPGRALHRDLPGLLLQPPGRDAALAERLCRRAQRQEAARRAARRDVRGSGPEEAGLLDGHRQRQDADHAPQLPPVPALQHASRWTTSC